jgi:3-oxoacyl-[acyl-carrier protein] reductase
MGEFSGKVAVITGGSRGIGRAIASALAREGAQTVIAASSAENLAVAAREMTGAPVPTTIMADLRELVGCEQVLAAVQAQFARCDILVNNAGATRAGNFFDLPDAAWLDGFALKFFGCVRMTRLFWPLLKEAQGHVVNIIGTAARNPGADFLIGGAVNAAMANLSKGLAQLGKRDGVNINVIHPGTTDTDRLQQLFAQRASASGKPVEELRRDALEKEGLRRLGQPDDVAALALFLCSERARHIQGTAIAVDGGATPDLY